LRLILPSHCNRVIFPDDFLINMLLLCIETSCDETAAAVVRDGRHPREDETLSRFRTAIREIAEEKDGR